MKLISGRFALLLQAAVVLTATGCGQRSLPPPDVVARIAGRELPYADFESYLRENSVDSETGLSSEVLSSLFDQYLDEALLGRLAVDEGFAEEDEPRRQAVEAMVRGKLPAEVSEAEITRFFDQYRADFGREERVILRQILVEEVERAQAALEAIQGGMLFEEAARQYSQGPGAELGGLQGELSRSDLPPAFADLIFELEAGQVSEIVAADYGFHLFQVIDKQSAAGPDLEAVREVIVSRLQHESRARLVDELVERARSSYNTTVYARNLPFNYAGFRR